MMSCLNICRPLLISAGVDVVLPFQSFKYSLLGVSAACPGILALFMKLNRPHFESYAQQYPHYLSNHKVPFRANFASANSHSLDNLPYLQSTGTEHSIYQVSVSSALYEESPQSCDVESGRGATRCNDRPRVRHHHHHRRQQHSDSIDRRFRDGKDDLDLPALISRLPSSITFQDFVSVVFRLSHGEVVSQMNE